MINQCNGCYTSIEDCINSRRCFMTGEYCSKQTNIQKERKKLHNEDSINAFVIMNFSNMSDVVYKWRLKSFIESLKKYLYISDSSERIWCRPSSRLSKEEEEQMKIDGWKQIERIKVIRADSDPASNYVICNRVCQQLQIADLVVVDVSVENTNVFYEFGMAVALGKMILPICYSESFYEMSIPEETAKVIKEQKKSYLEHHMDCYPWRKRLFEYYGIRYRSEKDSKQIDECRSRKPDFDIANINDNEAKGLQITRYLDFEEATKKEYGFGDMQYDRFPYHEIIDTEGADKTSIGKKIYNRLKETYNKSGYIHNTLVVYTMDGFLNDAQAGQCIINFYINITKQMKEEHCFCGDRVGVLIQANAIPEDVKDAKTEKKLLYSVGEIIQIGMNQATYTALKEKIKTRDFLKISDAQNGTESEWKEDIKRFVKEHIRNKSLAIYPNNPVYVNRVKNGLQKDILEEEGNGDFAFEYYFCLYHVMLRTLKYTNEIVVDISKNSLQSLFWLGAAHASDIYAITVQHEESDRERSIMTGTPDKKERNIFDVAGLWTAILRSYDTEGFYYQLELAQQGIEQHTKLMLKNVGLYEEKLKKYLYDTRHISPQEAAPDVVELLVNKDKEETRVLESYYRDRFWKPMLRYNRLWIYLPQVDGKNPKDGEPRLHTAKWDVDAIAALSHYLSKRKVIGEYHFKTLGEGVADDNADTLNFICVGDAARPLKKFQQNIGGEETGKSGTESLAEYISRQLSFSASGVEKGCNVIHERAEYPHKYQCFEGDEKKQRIYKGFAAFNGKPENDIYTQLPQPDCYDCMKARPAAESIISSAAKGREKAVSGSKDFENRDCDFHDINRLHGQLAQLILWREVPQADNGRVYFRVALTGVSGPATMALAAVLVDDDQKKEIFYIEGLEDNDDWEKLVESNPLNKLQERVRKQFMNIYLNKIGDCLRELSFKHWHKDLKDEGADYAEEKLTPQETAYIDRIKYAGGMYLSTVLYRYFLPFLSLEDEYRICNGMKIYVSSMMAAGISPFSLNYPPNGDAQFATAAPEKFVKKAAIAVTEVLEHVLHSFRGVEALYEVEVFVEEKKQITVNNFGNPDEDSSNEIASGKEQCDTRKVIGIKELSNQVNSPVNCLFCM